MALTRGMGKGRWPDGVLMVAQLVPARPRPVAVAVCAQRVTTGEYRCRGGARGGMRSACLLHALDKVRPVEHARQGGEVLAVAEEHQRGPALHAQASGQQVFAVRGHGADGERPVQGGVQLGQHHGHVQPLGKAYRVATEKQHAHTGPCGEGLGVVQPNPLGAVGLDQPLHQRGACIASVFMRASLG